MLLHQTCGRTIDQPKKIREAVDAIYPAWRKAYTALYGTPLDAGMGVFNWHQLWSNVPYMIPACDFNALVSPRAFQKLFLPDIDHQARSVGRAIFHLDGPDAARHINSLIALDSLDAIQYTPGAGTSSALAKLDMFRKVQGSGKSLLVICPIDEVIELCRSLDPTALAVMIEDAQSVQQLDVFYRAFSVEYGSI